MTTQSMFKTIAIAAILALGTIAHAQTNPYEPLCSPYENTCTPSVKSFANVFYSVPGLEVANLAIVNTGLLPANVKVTVTYTNPWDSVPVVATKDFLYLPNQRVDNFLTDPTKWPELVGYHGGVSVIVKSSQPIDASISMHPAYDSANPRAYWTGAKFLEGK
jgi:hypothetical protein